MQTTKDQRRAECPYCHKPLKKIPGAKTKCPYCGEFMFVRTKPVDKIRVVATKKEADKIESDWSIVVGTTIFTPDAKDFTAEKEILRKRFGGKEPSDNDVLWGLLNKQIIKNAQEGNWGSCRWTKFQMAELLRGEMRLKNSLGVYLEVCYLDLNDVRNRDMEALRNLPVKGFLYPYILDIIKRIIKNLDLSTDQVKQSFIEHNSGVEKSLRLPISVDSAWISLEKELNNQNNNESHGGGESNSNPRS